MSKKLRLKKTSKKLLLLKKKKYKQDVSFREKTKTSSLKRYRKKSDFESAQKGDGIDFYLELADEIVVKNSETNSVAKKFVLTYNKLSECLTISYTSFCRWVRNGMVPAPIFFDVRTGRAVYSVEEALIIITEIRQHTKKYAYYRGDHVQVRARISKQVTNYRKGEK